MPKNVTLTPNQFFKFLRDQSWDRPSAFFEYAARVGIRKPRELNMHAKYDAVFHDSKEQVTEEIKYLKEIFDGRIPPELMRDDWDT